MTTSFLKKTRLKAGMTQKGVADAMGVSQPNYQRWESGSAPIPEGKHKKLARVLGATVDELLGRPPAFDLLGVDPDVEDDRSYFGEVAIHFAKGTPLLLPVTEQVRASLLEQLRSSGTYVVAETLDNRMVVIRRDAITDVYFSSDAYDTYGPADQKYSDHLGLAPDDDFWKIVECQDCLDLLEDELEQERIDEVLNQVRLTEDQLDRLVADGHVLPEDRERVGAETAERSSEFMDRATTVCWQLTSGQLRRETATESEILYEVFCSFTPDDDDALLEHVIYLPLEGYHRTIVITVSALDYISIPKHKFNEGLIKCAKQDIDEDES